VKIKEGIARIIRKGETIIIVDENGNLFHTMDIFLTHISKEKMEETIKKAKEKK
jgi:uncharacterized protein YcgI (DUF1989 family)